jgi:hypothetical protein
MFKLIAAIFQQPSYKLFERSKKGEKGFAAIGLACKSKN